jgi:Fe/S biogenesis protein NfuA
MELGIGWPGGREEMTSSTEIDETLLHITDGARREVESYQAQQPKAEELALWTEVTGVSGEDYSYNLSLRHAGEAGPQDVIEQHEGLSIVIPADSVDKLRGAMIDLIGDLTTGGLIVENPNSPSPAVEDLPPLDVSGSLSERVTQVLAQQINPGIALHGGKAELERIEGTTAYLRLSGGCQGCGLAGVTLKRGVEVAIKRSVPEIVEIVDVTDHASGTNPYFEPSSM